MMDGVVHKFYLSSEFDINQEIENIISYKSFSEKHEAIKIEDNFIQILLANKYLIDVPRFDYNNKKLVVGIDPLSGGVFRNNQIPLFLNKIEVFEREIDNEANKAKINEFDCTKDEMLKELNKLKDFLKKGIETKMCIYHVGI
jgi:hypothetical protein